MISFTGNRDGLLFKQKDKIDDFKILAKDCFVSRKQTYKIIYNMMLNNMESMPHKKNWAKLVKQLLGCLGFNEVWVAQTVGDVTIFLSLVKQRMHDNFIQNWNLRLRESSRELFYSGISSFHYQHYLNFVRVNSIDRQ